MILHQEIMTTRRDIGRTRSQCSLEGILSDTLNKKHSGETPGSQSGSCFTTKQFLVLLSHTIRRLI